MQILRFFSLICFISYVSLANGQTISFYADAMINADNPEHRSYAAQQFKELFDEDVRSEGAFDKSYTDLPWISIQYAEDRTFRTITWQVKLDEGKYEYAGYLQTDSNTTYEIGSLGKRKSYDSNDILPIENWEGGLIYKILKTSEGGNQYFALTYRIKDQFTKVKTLEPLNFAGEQVTIGKVGLFTNPSDRTALTARIAMIYSADSNASVKYEEEASRWVFDNLIMVQGRIPGQGPTKVPDGSYKGYDWKDGKWHYVDKLFTQINDGALDPAQKKKMDNRLFKGKG